MTGLGVSLYLQEAGAGELLHQLEKITGKALARRALEHILRA